MQLQLALWPDLRDRIILSDNPELISKIRDQNIRQRIFHI